MLTFYREQQCYRYKYSNSVCGLIIQRGVYLNGCIFGGDCDFLNWNDCFKTDVNTWLYC